MFIHREGKKNHMVGGEVAMLQDTDALWCHRGPQWGLGLVAAQGGHLWVGWGKDVGTGAGSQHS